ncbi:MAG TPA: methyltransferase domain-containing protein [Stellaceae bacterium]|nr:methyltransferase domain-containing protein [Stellaceae bacterium]
MYRERIKEHCGSAANILALRRAPEFGARLFVADHLRGKRLVRMLGAVDGSGMVMEQSAMDLLRPERLVYGYERLMLAAFAMVPEPRSALLLGLGGGAMWRHLHAYLPDCALTIVERSPEVRAFARRYFHLKHPVILADAAEVAARSRGAFDVVLVDLYDGGGAATMPTRFWQTCVEALSPGGCIAVNWAEFVSRDTRAAEARTVTKAAGRACFLVERHSRPNIIQLAPIPRRLSLDEVRQRYRRFARAHRLPKEDRDTFSRANLRWRYPVI